MRTPINSFMPLIHIYISWWKNPSAYQKDHRPAQYMNKWLSSPYLLLMNKYITLWVCVDMHVCLQERESKQVLCDQVRACACVWIISSYIHLWMCVCVCVNTCTELSHSSGACKTGGQCRRRAELAVWTEWLAYWGCWAHSFGCHQGRDVCIVPNAQQNPSKSFILHPRIFTVW